MDAFTEWKIMGILLGKSIPWRTKADLIANDCSANQWSQKFSPVIGTGWLSSYKYKLKYGATKIIQI